MAVKHQQHFFNNIFDQSQSLCHHLYLQETKMTLTIHTRRRFLHILRNGLMAVPLAGLACRQRPSRPNIVMIIGDDIGFSDIGPYGSEIPTPHLDRLAQNGMRFTQFYNMAKCNPTRSTLFTGLYKGDERALNFTSLLKQAGYYTITSGKEHFDSWVPDRCYAKNCFDKSFLFWATTEYFIPPGGKFERPFFLNGRQIAAQDIKAHQKPFYKTDAITDYALDWLDKPLNENQPFFLLLPYHSAHYPLQARAQDIQKFRGTYRKGWDIIRRERFLRMKNMGVIAENCRLSEPEGNINKFRGHPPGDEKRRAVIPLYRPWDSLSDQEKDELDLEMSVFAAMVYSLDINIGRVLDKLENAGVLDNTLVLFFSDNGSCPFDSNKNFDHPPGGPASYRTLCAAWANVGNTPYRYYKQFGHEGGCNTHFIAHWPGVIPADSITDQAGHVVDIFPTLLELTGTAYPQEYQKKPTVSLHGRSLLPVLRGGQRSEPAWFMSGFTDRFRMFRSGRWKIVKANAGEWELYDMETDPSETDNLAEKKQAKLKEMIELYAKAKLKIQLD